MLLYVRGMRRLPLCVCGDGVFAVEDEEGDGADGGEGESDEGGGGYAKAVADCHASYGGGDGVRHVEGYLYAGPSKHLATFGVFHN